jgi:hypothetical protein
MADEPGTDLGMFVGSVVVEDRVDHPADRDLALDRVQETNELLVPVARYAAPDDLASSTLSAANSVVVPWRL